MHFESDPSSSPTNTPPASPPAFQGAFRLCRFAGVDVFVHWTWFVAAYFLLQDRPVAYSSVLWDIAEYVAGFGIVLLHEFGHVFGCRSVGGAANRVLLWPLGGLAFVSTPPRPGATLWTIAAGPLVNVVLGPILFGLTFLTAPSETGETTSDAFLLIRALAWFNVVILVFNLLPIFPLDGGQILQSLLWFCFGRAAGLAIAASIGLLAGAALLILALSYREWWLAIMMGFLSLGSWRGLKQARVLFTLSRAERRTDRVCPQCDTPSPVGAFWICSGCRAPADAFDSGGACPKCQQNFTVIPCPRCSKTSPADSWNTDPLSPIDLATR